MKNGFSKDNYIIDQNYFSKYSYRGCPANYNGCGPIAVYNLLKFHRIHKNIEDIITEMNNMYVFKIPGPTSMKVLKEYLNRYFEFDEYHGKETCLKYLKFSSSGIVRYNENGVPHLICYIKVDKDKFRFFNLEDGFEDCILTTDEYSERILPGYTALIIPRIK